MSKSVAKITEYGLHDKVVELAKYMSLQNMAEVINKKYLPEGAEEINPMTIKRYCDSNNIVLTDKRFNSSGIPKLTNTLEEAQDMNKYADKNIEVLQKMLENFKKDLFGIEIPPGADKAAIVLLLKSCVNINKETRDTSLAIEKWVNRKIMNLDRITEYQASLLKLENYKKLFLAMISVIESYGDPEIKAQFINAIHDDHEMFDLFRGIMADEKKK